MSGPLKTVFLKGLLSLCILPGFAAGQEPGEKQHGSSQTIQVAVEMVSLPVVVTSRDGRYVTGLRKEDFGVFEDGIKQEIAGFATTEEPVSVALALDTSGSTEYQLKRIQDEAIRFVNLLRPDDSVAILAFADDVRLLEPFNIERKKNTSAIREIRPGGLTALYEAVWLALEQVLKHEYGRKALVLFTDGVDNRSDTVSKDETLELARETRATIYGIYFDTDADPQMRMPGARPGAGRLPFQRLPFPRFPPGSRGKRPEYVAGHEYLMKLSEYSGGLVLDAKKMDDLGPAFAKIARELAHQYSLGYYSTNPKHDGQFRTVEVKLNKPGLTARTKQGYYVRQR